MKPEIKLIKHGGGHVVTLDNNHLSEPQKKVRDAWQQASIALAFQVDELEQWKSTATKAINVFHEATMRLDP